MTACGTSEGPDAKAPVGRRNDQNLEIPDAVIPMKFAEKVSAENLSAQNTTSSSRRDEIDFRKMSYDYPASSSLRIKIETIEFSGNHEEVWTQWNSKMMEAVERIKSELRRLADLPQKNRKQFYQANRVEIEPTEKGYTVNFIPMMDGVESFSVPLEL